jgi:hypothetical protein
VATHFTIGAAGGRHAFVLTSTDETVMDLFDDSPLFAAVGRARVGARAFGRAELLAAARALLADVRAQWELLPYRYATEVRMMGREDLKSSGSGGVHGFRIGGRIHSIDGGPGRCVLSEWDDGPGGRGVVVATRDVRREKRVETDDWGPIKISRRKIDVRLPLSLEALVAFLDGRADEAVRGRTTDGGASVTELVRRAAEGDESAEEALFERGDAARAELLKKATDPKARRHHGTIAWLLLTVLPSPESRAAVEAMADREADEGRRRELLVLLASTAG